MPARRVDEEKGMWRDGETWLKVCRSARGGLMVMMKGRGARSEKC
jgi:hypothetical protein